MTDLIAVIGAACLSVIGCALLILAWKIWRSPTPGQNDYEASLVYNPRAERFEVRRRLSNAFINRVLK